MGYIMDLRKIVGHRTLLMPAACLIIGDGNGNVLLQKRVDDGKWSLHGGSIELDEKCEDAMRREAKEELGLDIKEYNLLGVYSGKEFHHTYPNGDDVSIIDVVYYTKYDGSPITLQKSEVSEVRWFNVNELPDNLFARNEVYFNDYKKVLGELK